MGELIRELAFSSDGSKLFTSTSKKISIYDSSSGELVKSRHVPEPTFNAEHEEQLKKTKTTTAETTNLRYLRVTADGKYLIGTLDDSKMLFVLDSDTLETINQVLFPKRPCCLALIPNSTRLIAGDKFGDVFEIDFLDKEARVTEPILGHVSMLVDLKMASHDNQQVIISADRDEHIRITKFPQTYIIDRWLFGHSEFVSSLCLVPENDSLLISGGGDDFLAVWDWTTGEQKSILNIRSHVEKYLDELHKGPENRSNDQNHLEITVQKILAYGSRKFLLLCEGTNVLLDMKLDEKNQLELTNIVEFDDKILDFDANSTSVAVSLQSRAGNFETIEINKLATGNWKSKMHEYESAGSINAHEHNEENTSNLYLLKALRKRNDF